MRSWLLPAAPSPAALDFRQRWAERWPDYDPRYGDGAPEAVFSDHRHAHPEFRNPLSATDGLRASAEFHAAVIDRLAVGQPITLMTFDYESASRGARQAEVSGLDGILERELAWSVVEPAGGDDEDPGETTVHVFVSSVATEDPRLAEVWARTAIGAEPLLVVGAGLDWLARPHEACVAVDSFDEADIETLRSIERETWERWGVPQERVARLDLARVAAYVNRRRVEWEDDGVRVVTEPQYRTWRDHDDLRGIVHELPGELDLTDWFLVGLRSDTAEATLIAHDSGACTIQLDPALDDVDAELVFEHRGRAGSLDLGGVVEVFERVVGVLAARAAEPRVPEDELPGVQRPGPCLAHLPDSAP